FNLPTTPRPLRAGGPVEPCRLPPRGRGWRRAGGLPPARPRRRNAHGRPAMRPCGKQRRAARRNNRPHRYLHGSAPAKCRRTGQPATRAGLPPVTVRYGLVSQESVTVTTVLVALCEMRKAYAWFIQQKLRLWSVDLARPASRAQNGRLYTNASLCRLQEPNPY